MKDYRAFAHAWLDAQGMRDGLDTRAGLLGVLFEEAYEEGRRAEAKRQARDEETTLEQRSLGAEDSEGEFDSVILARQHEELTQKTIKILGRNRTREALKAVPHLRRAVAMHAQVDVRVLRDFLEGQPVNSHTAARIAQSFHELGVGLEPRSPSPSDGPEFRSGNGRSAQMESDGPELRSGMSASSARVKE